MKMAPKSDCKHYFGHMVDVTFKNPQAKACSEESLCLNLLNISFSATQEMPPVAARHLIHQEPKAKIFKSERFIESKMVGRFGSTAHSFPPAFPNLIKQQSPPPTWVAVVFPALEKQVGFLFFKPSLIRNFLSLYLAAIILMC